MLWIAINISQYTRNARYSLRVVLGTAINTCVCTMVGLGVRCRRVTRVLISLKIYLLRR